MDKLIEKLFTIIERYILPIVLVVGFLLYKKFGDFFSDKKKEEEKRQVAAAEHQESLTPDYRDPKKAKSESERKRIIVENGEKAKEYKAALYAERIRTCTDLLSINFSVAFRRSTKLFDYAAMMKQHKVSLSRTAAAYKRMTGNDMFADVRGIMGTDYTKWLALAGTVK